MTKRTIRDDQTIRHADITVDVTQNVVTVTAGRGDDHQHIELTPDQALRLADALAGVTRWDDEA